MTRKRTNFDVFKKKLVEDLKPETVCRTIMCNACPFRDKNAGDSYPCRERFVAWLNEEAK